MLERDFGVAAPADGAGVYREYLPPAALGAHFQCVWLHRAAQDHSGPVEVVPDGCVDMIWREGRLHVAGPDITTARPILKAGAVVLGARFRAGAASGWLGLPMSEIVGRAVDMADLWDARSVADINDRVGDAASPVAQARRLLRALAERAPSQPDPEPAAARMFAWLRRGLGSAEPVATLRRRLDMSERTLLRRSRQHFGYGPKTPDRILRFQRFQAAARCADCASLAEMAAEVGYADQAHLGREIQALCGMSAATYVRQLGG
ncbi:AraC family transcriptional regulator [Kaistia sp. MMO-174]|uniref:AraC family transcriptional regulator n=1 Tax=Kaistia sp. MMO-174 TaxID=3081256 RepID=UPI003016239D